MRASSSFLLGLTGLASASGAAKYQYSLVDADGNDVPFEVTHVADLTSARFHQDDTSKRAVESANWCGAVQLEPTSGTFDSIVGTYTVPTVTPPTDGTGVDSLYYLYQWVGIDGYYWTSSCDALIQAGTGFILEDDEVYEIFVWTEYYPDGVNIVNMDASEGDVITVTVTTTSTSTGVITIENETTGQTLTADIDGTGVGTLCGQTAEWIMENPWSTYEPFPDFTTMDFTGCSASTSSGVTQNIDGATILEGGNSTTGVTCDASMISDTELAIIYVG